MFINKSNEVSGNTIVNGHANGHTAATEAHRPVAKPMPPKRGSESPTTATTKYPFEGVVGDGYVLIGKGTKITGDISDCTLVEVQGVLEGSVTADSVIIRDGGGFKGTLQTDQAEIHGILEGTVVVHELLDIRANGNVQGDLTYGRIAIAEGGFVSGNLQTKTDYRTSEPAALDLVVVNGGLTTVSR